MGRTGSPSRPTSAGFTSPRPATRQRDTSAPIYPRLRRRRRTADAHRRRHLPQGRARLFRRSARRRGRQHLEQRRRRRPLHRSERRAARQNPRAPPGFEPDVRRRCQEPSLHRRLEHAVLHLPESPRRCRHRERSAAAVCAIVSGLPATRIVWPQFYERAFGFARTGETSITGLRLRRRLWAFPARWRARHNAAAWRPGRLSSSAFGRLAEPIRLRMCRRGVRSFSTSRSSFPTWPTPTHDWPQSAGWTPISTDGPQVLPAVVRRRHRV